MKPPGRGVDRDGSHDAVPAVAVRVRAPTGLRFPPNGRTCAGAGVVHADRLPAMGGHEAGDGGRTVEVAVTFGLLAAWAVHDLEEVAAMPGWARGHGPGLRQRYPHVPEQVWRRLESMHGREFATAVAVRGYTPGVVTLPLVAGARRGGHGRNACGGAAVAVPRVNSGPTQPEWLNFPWCCGCSCQGGERAIRLLGARAAEPRPQSWVR
ncbi:HXXEE domain-containing protein [Streptomyces sp. NBC_01518]|uniref:HXXEE domain-containing protein n=1 Tax=Streptomyces sp. NBC_01518 TaxID=2903891 RepID=UPI003868AC74